MVTASARTLQREAESAVVDAANLLTALAAIATLQEQNFGLQRQVDNSNEAQRQLEVRVRDLIAQAEKNSMDLTDAKFVTFRTLLDSNGEQVRIALTATQQAIDKAERATERAIEKAEAANDKRFESVNEFRAQLTDLIARFATLERVDLLYNQTNQRIDEYKTNTDMRLLGLENRVTSMEAASRGAAGNVTKIYAAIIGMSAFLGIVVVLMNTFSE